jgi:hypothetical protein
MTSPWLQTGAFDTAQYSAEYNPLTTFPSSLQTPNIEGDFTDFFDNLGPEILEGIVDNIVPGLEQLFTYIIDNWESIAGDIISDLVSLFTGGGGGVDTIWTEVLDALGFTVDEFISWIEGIGTLATDALSLSTWEGFLGDVVSALGGVGSDISDFVSALEAIPQGNISGLITDLGNLLSISTWTTFLGDVVTALGGSGSLVADFVSALEAIPQGNISGLITDLGNLLSISTWTTFLGDVVTALGGSGSLVADFVSALEAIPQGNISGLITDLGNLLSISTWTSWLTAIISELGGSGSSTSTLNTLLGDVQSDASGAFTWLGDTVDGILGDVTGSFPKTYPYTWAAATSTDLTTWLGNLLPVSQFQQFIDGIVNDGTENNPISAAVETFNGIADAIPGIQAISDSINSIAGTTIGGSITSIENALGSFPHTNITGTLGPDNIGASVGSMLDGIWQGLTGGTNTGNSIGAISSAAAITASTANTAQTIGQNNSATLANRAVTKPSYIGLDPSGDPTFPYSLLAGTGGSLPTVVIVQSSTMIGMIGTPDAGVKKSVAWIGAGWSSGTITNMYVSIYSVNTSTGALSLLSTSADLIASGSPPSSSSVPAWYYYNLPSANYITTAQGNWYAVELLVVGTGTYSLAGLTHHAPTSLTTYPAALGASRVSLTTPTFDAQGGGYQLPVAATSLIGSLSHTAAAGADVFVVTETSSSGTIGSYTAWTRTCTYGGVSMTSLGAVNDDNASGGWLEVFHLANVSGGAAVVTWSVSGGGATITTAGMQSVSYTNVGTVGSLVTNNGSGTALTSGTINAQTVGQIVFNCMNAGQGSATTLTGYTATNLRGNISAITAGDYSLFCIGDTPGASNVSFAATTSQAFWWASISFILTGNPVYAPASINPPSYNVNVPFLQLCGSAGAATLAPSITEYSTAGSFTYTIPTEFQVSGYLFDIVLIGGGGCGSNGVAGNSGTPGTWNGVTLTYGTSFPLGTTTFSVIVGTGGPVATEDSGQNSAVIVPTYGTIYGDGGAGGTYDYTEDSYGYGAGNFSFNGTVYYGGLGASGYSAYGNPPGGAGSGQGYGGVGGAGAQGAVWITAYQ